MIHGVFIFLLLDFLINQLFLLSISYIVRFADPLEYLHVRDHRNIGSTIHKGNHYIRHNAQFLYSYSTQPPDILRERGDRQSQCNHRNHKLLCIRSLYSADHNGNQPQILPPIFQKITYNIFRWHIHQIARTSVIIVIIHRIRRCVNIISNIDKCFLIPHYLTTHHKITNRYKKTRLTKIS